MSVASPAVAAILAKLQKVKSHGGSWMACCPAHEDRNPSLSIAEGKDGRVLLTCHAGCTFESIRAALGAGVDDFFAGPLPANGNGHAAPAERTALVTTYDYVDASGALLFQSCRFVDPAGKKTFRQRRPDQGKWLWSLGDLAPVLYHLPSVLAAVESGRSVFVVEGEKDADALTDLGFTATTNPMGAGKWRPWMSESLKRADVVILPDNDEPGRAHAEEVAASLTAQGATVRVVVLPNLPDKGDVSDWLAAGGTLDALGELIAKTRRWSPDPRNQTRWRLDELWANDDVMRPPPPIVPRLAWAGRSTLVAAREKAGKSTLTGFITASVSNGSDFLGEPCQQGIVLVIGLEEFIGDTARRLRQFGADPTKVYLVDRFANDPAQRPAEFRAHIAAVSPTLIIVDSLTAYSHGQIQDDNNATQMAKVVQPLTDAVHQSGAALVLIHHASKATGKSRGSTAITAAVDVVCEFEIPDEDADPTLRRVRSVGRVPLPRLYDVRFDGTTYTLANGIEAPLDQRILDVVAERPGISRNDLADSVRGRRQDVLTQITQLCASGRLLSTGSARVPRLELPRPTSPTFDL